MNQRDQTKPTKLNLENQKFQAKCLKCNEPNITNQIYQTKSIQSNLQNLNQQTNSTRQNLEKPNLQKREYLVNILIMHERHFHFLSVVADRLQDGHAACPQLWNESESAARALLKC